MFSIYAILFLFFYIFYFFLIIKRGFQKVHLNTLRLTPDLMNTKMSHIMFLPFKTCNSFSTFSSNPTRKKWLQVTEKTIKKSFEKFFTTRYKITKPVV